MLCLRTCEEGNECLVNDLLRGLLGVVSVVLLLPPPSFISVSLDFSLLRFIYLLRRVTLVPKLTLRRTSENSYRLAIKWKLSCALSWRVFRYTFWLHLHELEIQ